MCHDKPAGTLRQPCSLLHILDLGGAGSKLVLDGIRNGIGLAEIPILVPFLFALWISAAAGKMDGVVAGLPMLAERIVFWVGVEGALIGEDGVGAHNRVGAVHMSPGVVFGKHPALGNVEGLDPHVEQPVSPLAAADQEIADVHAPSARRDHEVCRVVVEACWRAPSRVAPAGHLEHFVQHHVARHAFG